MHVTYLECSLCILILLAIPALYFMFTVACVTHTQVKSDTYGDAAGGAGGTNEMFYDEFRTVLGSGVLEEKLLPQAKKIIVETLLAAQSTLEVDPTLSGAGSFNVYGFDLMVDDAHNVKLIEVSGVWGSGWFKKRMFETST